MDESEHLVRTTATRFRCAFATVQGELSATSFEQFPRGACGDAADLLGQYFEDSGLGTWERVSGTKYQPTFGTHAWIERDGLIVDITADQFDGIDEPVIVTRDRTWHSRYPDQRRRLANLLHCGASAALAPDYRRLQAAADA